MSVGSAMRVHFIHQAEKWFGKSIGMAMASFGPPIFERDAHGRSPASRDYRVALQVDTHRKALGSYTATQVHGSRRTCMCERSGPTNCSDEFEPGRTR
jgi:hypothetical protein